jgi:DNA polymerase-4
MPISQCQKLCPHAVFIPIQGSKYVFVSLQVLNILNKYSDRVEMSSIDEGYLDMTHHQIQYSCLEEMGSRIKNEIREKLNLTCSVGIAPNRYVAKMVTGLNKPNGLTVMDLHQYRFAFGEKKVSALIGVGESTEKALNSLGIKTVSQLAQFPDKMLESCFGVWGPRLKKLALGEYDGDASDFEADREDKSVGHEHTFGQDVSDINILISSLLKLSSKAARRLRQGSYCGKRVTLKLRYSDFSTFNHQITLNFFTSDEAEIFQSAVKCLKEIYLIPRPVRLIGVRVSQLKKSPNPYSSYQTDLFKGKTSLKKNLVLKASDLIRDRFGEDALYYAGMTYF